MGRFSRINTIWRKELKDTLRDRRTLIAMVLVPMVLYPALMLGSFHAFEVQTTRLRNETYHVGVQSAAAKSWLRKLIDTDLARRTNVANVPVEDLPEVVAQLDEATPTDRVEPEQVKSLAETSREEAARQSSFDKPPEYIIDVVDDVHTALVSGTINVGVVLRGDPPTHTNDLSAEVTLVADNTDFRASLAQAGLAGIFSRMNDRLISMRLDRLGVVPTVIHPISLAQENIAPPEKIGASVIAQIVPLILIIMTITGAIYPAIDLTAGERERNTLETLMVAPVPAADLITGKFVVVALIGMLSAALNLASIGGTIYLSGVGGSLVNQNNLAIPLHVLPWVFVILLPLALLFSAALLAVCSFARSFKEAQNYVMPVMMAALIPAIVGVLPGMRLEGPLVVMPVTNIVLLTRDLFLGTIDYGNILWVASSTMIYAAAAITIAARLFGQEAVLFNDNASIQTIFQRRHFKPRAYPTAAQAFLLLSIVYSLNYFIQQSIQSATGVNGLGFFYAVSAVMLILFVALPFAAAIYLKLNPAKTFALEFPHWSGWIAALCFGCSTWILGIALFAVQQKYYPMPDVYKIAFEQFEQILSTSSLWQVLFVAAVVPAVCEELFFRGFALSGLRRALGPLVAVLVVSFAFGLYHGSIFRLAGTFSLGLMLGLLVIRYRALWLAMLVHLMHNGLSIATSRPDGLAPLFANLGFELDASGMPPQMWIIGAAALAILGVIICIVAPQPQQATDADQRHQNPAEFTTPAATPPHETADTPTARVEVPH